MNKAFNKQIDKVVNDVNNINKDQLASISVDYLKCKKKGKYLYILSIFDCAFLVYMDEIHHSLNIQFPNKVFKCYVVLVIDLEMNRYETHRLYTFPINVDLYDSRLSSRSLYSKILEQIEKNPLIINHDMPYSFSSKSIDVTKPYSKSLQQSFMIRGKIKTSFHFDIDEFISRYPSFTSKNNNLHFNDPYYTRTKITRDMIINDLSCDCVDNEKDLKFACFCDYRVSCRGYHTRKCKCGKITYRRTNSCLKCHLTYSTSMRLHKFFNYQFNSELNKSTSSMISHIPYLHYNQGTSGLCLGSGVNVIDSMITYDINPIRLMLSFKANLSYTDADNSINYYTDYRDRLSNERIDKYVEFLNYLKNIFKYKIKFSNHVFSLYCYCPQCLFLKIVLLQERKKLHERGIEVIKTYLVSRDKFIDVYKKYMLGNKASYYIKSYIHQIIKTTINTKPRDFLIIE